MSARMAFQDAFSVIIVLTLYLVVGSRNFLILRDRA